MGSFSLVHWILVILVVVLLFGRGRISDIMGDVAKGIKSFKKGLADDPVPPAPTAMGEPPRIQNGSTSTGQTIDAKAESKEQAQG